MNSYQHFIELLFQTGLAEDRIFYWLHAFQNKNFSVTDEEVFFDEIRAHLARIQNTLTAFEDNLTENQSVIRKNEAELLPYLLDLEQKQASFYDKNFFEYKNSLIEGEKSALGAIENIRNSKGNTEIEYLRKKLGQK